MANIYNVIVKKGIFVLLNLNWAGFSELTDFIMPCRTTSLETHFTTCCCIRTCYCHWAACQCLRSSCSSSACCFPSGSSTLHSPSLPGKGFKVGGQMVWLWRFFSFFSSFLSSLWRFFLLCGTSCQKAFYTWKIILHLKFWKQALPKMGVLVILTIAAQAQNVDIGPN